MASETRRKAYLADDDGGITILGLFLAVTCMVLGGLAVDVSNAIAVRTQMQVAADTAAHAALYTRVEDDASVAVARQKALDIVRDAFPEVIQGNLLQAGDILFGHYDIATGGFQVDNTSYEAAMVYTSRTAERGNPISTFMLRLMGYNSMGLRRASIFVAYDDPCLRDGWVAEGVVDAQSNNSFYDGFCVHSNDHVSVNQNNYWEAGVKVTMPYKGDIDVPANDFSRNVGLPEALGSDYTNLRILRHLDQIFAGIADPKSEYKRPYLTNPNQWDVIPDHTLTPADFKTGRVNRVDCGSGTLADTSMELPPAVRYADLDMYQLLPYAHELAANGVPGAPPGNGGGNPGNGGGAGKITIDASSATLADVAIYTDCEIKFANNSALENVVIYSTNTGDKSISSSQGLRLGADDHCDPTGGVQIMTRGGFAVAAGLEIFSSQVIALGPIQFAADANGVEGGSFISGQTIDGTSLSNMSACPPSGVQSNFSVKSFRMAG